MPPLTQVKLWLPVIIGWGAQAAWVLVDHRFNQKFLGNPGCRGNTAERGGGPTKIMAFQSGAPSGAEWALEGP